MFNPGDTIWGNLEIPAKLPGANGVGRMESAEWSLPFGIPDRIPVECANKCAYALIGAYHGNSRLNSRWEFQIEFQASVLPIPVKHLGNPGDKILGIIAKIWVIPVIKLDIANPGQGKP